MLDNNDFGRGDLDGRALALLRLLMVVPDVNPVSSGKLNKEVLEDTELMREAAAKTGRGDINLDFASEFVAGRLGSPRPLANTADRISAIKVVVCSYSQTENNM